MKRLALILFFAVVSCSLAGPVDHIKNMLRARRALNASGSAPEWTDPNEASLAFRFWFDDDTYQTNDTSANLKTIYYANGTPTREVIGTNANGRVDNAYSFDADDYLQSYALSAVAVTSLTISLWCKIKSWPGNYDGLFYGYKSGQRLSIANNFNSSIIMQFPDQSAYGNWASGSIPTNEWHHLVFQWASNSVYNLWLDTTGKTVTASGTMTAFVMDVAPIISDAHAGSGINGLLDDVRIYTNRVLSASEVTNLNANTAKPNNDIENGGVWWP